MPEYYLTKNATRAVETGGKKFVFEAAEYFSPTASWWGTLAVSDPADIELLDAAAKKGLIEKIPLDDYEKLEVKKKKRHVSPSLIELKHWHAPQMGVVRKDAAPAVVDSRDLELEAIADAIQAKPAAPVSKSKK